MAKEDTPLDQGVFDSTLEAELAKGTDRRVAEGRARSAAVRAFRVANPEEAAKHEAAGAKPAAAAAAGGNGGAAAPAAAPAAAAASAGAPGAVAASVTTPMREAPLPTGNLPTPKKGA
ncbi:MAG TPA: hypothetical protein VNC60_04040, partial [Actinomycetota bacterium]|nr:hypothetical protein [Actinomycetota bacterium]